MPRTKSPSPVIPVPQTRAEAADYLRQIGEHQRAVDRAKIEMDERIAIAERIRADQTAVPQAQLALLVQGLQAFCDAHRAALTDGHKVKTVDLGTGTVSWRTQPVKVSVRGVEAVIARLKELRYGRYLRRKEEIDKDAILAAPTAIRARLATIPGLSIGSDGEAFAVTPLGMALADAPSIEEAA